MTFNTMQTWNMNPNQSLTGQGASMFMNPNQSLAIGAGNTSPFQIENINQPGVMSMDSGIFNRNNLAAANTAIGAASAGVQLWQGMQQLDLAREQLAFQKETFAKNWQNQVSLTNTRMRDRQNARTGANPYAYQSTSQYMKENEVI